MNLLELIRRVDPLPWSEGNNIPWNDPDFSRRMLIYHLSQDLDAASRRTVIIDQHVRFIHERLLAGQPGRILDMACGPGLYTHRLARLGHTIYGIDFSPASIEYAEETAAREGLAGACSYQLADLREAVFGPEGSYDLAMFIFGELNVFCPPDVRALLRKAYAALKPGGTLLLEPSPEAWIRKLGAQTPSWSAAPTGLFSNRPHLLLEESFWTESLKASTTRYFVVDLETSQVTRHAASYQAYSDDEYRALLEACGFRDVRFYPSLRGDDTSDEDMFVIVSTR